MCQNTDKLKDDIESKFKSKISDICYTSILQEIEIIVTVNTVLNDIISKIV